MVKGISKQVILVKPQEDDLFEQAIFFVKDNAHSFSEQDLLRQAKEALKNPEGRTKPDGKRAFLGFLAGALVASAMWLSFLLI